MKWSHTPPLCQKELRVFIAVTTHMFFCLFVYFKFPCFQGGVDQKMPLVVSRINPESPVSNHVCFPLNLIDFYFCVLFLSSQ